MCGICGILSGSAPPDPETLLGMTRLMAHRGPDDEGIWIEGLLGLGHRRLSVIDTSRAGRQPMADWTGTFHIVYNGEIYNFQELREDLVARGARFRTRTDTEVILEAYKAYDLEFLDRLHGMFAFAIWDGVKRRLLLARDRIGKKPLYYRSVPHGGLAFASSLKPLARLTPALGAIEPQALRSYFTLGFVPGPTTLLAGVSKLEPGCMLLLDPPGPLVKKAYWDLASFFRNKTDFADERQAADELSGLFDDAVKRRLVADVPIGVFLSGGMDSSAVVAAMASFCASPPSAFSIGFQERSFDELPMARYVAQHYGVLHHTATLGASAADSLEDIVRTLDEPLADSSIIPCHHLARFARQRATVCLTGDGGDELFAGYDTYIATRICRHTAFVPRAAKRMALFLLNRLPVSRAKVPLDFKLRQFLALHSPDVMRSHASWRSVFTPDDEKNLFRADFAQATRGIDPLGPVLRYAREAAGLHFLDAAMYVDMKTWLVDDILVKVDRTAMAFGLEPRSPLLDQRLIQFAASLPVSYKLKGLSKKRLFKLSQQKRLPRRCLEQEKKGFNAPLGCWLDSELKIVYQRLMADTTSILHDILNIDYLATLYRQHHNNEAENGHKLFSLLVLYLWGEYFHASI